MLFSDRLLSVGSRLFPTRAARAITSLLILSTILLCQSTGALQGTIADITGAVLPNATITVNNTATGQRQVVRSNGAGLYSAPSLAPGAYSIEVKADGLQTTTASNVIVGVGTSVRQDFTLNVAGSSQSIEIQAAAAAIDTTTASLGQVVNQRTVQEIPLNGRHFVDLALLVPGTVTPPQNGFLTAPLRGQGTNSFNSAGGREDTVNFMINGVNMNDIAQNQITFQPTVNTVEEFKIDNSTFSAEYGRNSGSIVNIATRPGTNQWHGEAYDYLRNSALDARNYANPSPILQSPFRRNQFGGALGLPIKKDKTFLFLSYEQLKQQQSLPLSTPVLSTAQRAQAAASPSPVVRQLLPLIPVANSSNNTFSGNAIAPVEAYQGTGTFTHSFNESNRIGAYYARQHDLRNEPTTSGNTLPGFGDTRAGVRELLTLNYNATITPALVNEARLGFNHIHITFAPENTLNSADFGINNGINAPIGLPQINVQGAFSFGGLNNFPQGREDYTAIASDTLSWIRGKHTVKVGGEYRQAIAESYTQTPGTFGFASVADFLGDRANSFTVNTSNRTARIYIPSVGGFAQDAYKVSRNFTLNLGLRYDWNGTPIEGNNRFTVFDPRTSTLVPVGQSGGLSHAYNQSALNFQPRVGFAWDIMGNGKTVVRSAYAIFIDQPNVGLVSGLAVNPPNSRPVNFTTTAAPFASFSDAFSRAGGSVALTSVAQNYKNANVQSWNFGLQQQLGNSYNLSATYVGSKGTNLNIARNYNQPINGVRPYARLAANSFAGANLPLSNITVAESVGNSSYQAFWLTVQKRFSKGLQFNGSYTWSKSIDLNSRNNQGVVVQDSYNIAGDRGLSDFDARHRFVLSGIYYLPFRGNRLVEGWEFAIIETLQSGNPITFRTSNTGFTGNQTVRASVRGDVGAGLIPSTNGNASFIGYLANPSALYAKVNAFGDLGRNVIIGPGFSNLDFSIVKNTKITEKTNLQIRGDAFDLLNQTNFGQPGATIGTTTYGLINSTRFPTGDSGSSRQLQLAMKFIF